MSPLKSRSTCSPGMPLILPRIYTFCWCCYIFYSNLLSFPTCCFMNKISIQINPYNIYYNIHTYIHIIICHPQLRICKWSWLDLSFIYPQNDVIRIGSLPVNQCCCSTLLMGSSEKRVTFYGSTPLTTWCFRQPEIPFWRQKDKQHDAKLCNHHRYPDDNFNHPSFE